MSGTQSPVHRYASMTGCGRITSSAPYTTGQARPGHDMYGKQVKRLSGFSLCPPPSSRLPVIDKLLGHHLPPIGWTKLRQPPLARRLIVWNIQNSTIIQVPAAHGHLKIHIVALSRFAVHRPCISDRALRQLHPSNHQGSNRERDAHQGSAAHPGFAPKKRHVHVVTLRYSSRFDASGRLPWSCNPSQNSSKSHSSVRSGLTAAPQAISPGCMQVKRHVFVFMTALLDRLEPACLQRCCL